MPGDPPLFGVNLAGCTFTKDIALCPTKADVDRYLGLGFGLIRLPLADHHLLDTGYRKQIAELVRHIQARGGRVILDRHDFKRHSAADALAFWEPVLKSFSPDTMIELANEPVKGYPRGSNPWMISAKDTRDTVMLFRSRGITNPILFGWPGYSAIFRADKNEWRPMSAASILTAIDRVGGIKDPLNRTFLSGHRYLDRGGSGTSGRCAVHPESDGGIAAFAEALRRRGLKAYITEYAFGSYRGIESSCRRAGINMIRAMRANSDVIRGAAAWGGGRAWRDSYIYKIEAPGSAAIPDNGKEYIAIIAGKR